MFRCPRCNVELSPDARFCPSCGFNQTNARMQKVAPPQAATGIPAGTPLPAPVTPSINPGSSTVLPPTPSTLSSVQHRSFQPDVKRVLPPRMPPPHEQPASPQMQGAGPQKQPPENTQWQENKVPPLASTLLPVRTNTPPRSGKTMPETPSPQSDQSRSPIGQRAGDAELADGSLQTNEDAAQGKGLSLTRRYMSEQETRHQPAFPVNNAPTEPPVGPPSLSGQSGWDRGPIMQHSPVMQHSPIMQRGAMAMVQSPPEMPIGFNALTEEGSESLIATSKAAEHWRESWRDRQHDEAGPAIGITRGQAQVPEPLMAMQHSIARMRAIVLPKNPANQHSKNFVFWFALVLLICIIGGLSVYVISTYMPSTQLAAQVSGVVGVSPTLTIQNTQKNTLAAGQTLHVHGAYFGPNHVIIFMLATTLLTTTGPVQSNSKGTFDAALAIPATWLAGSYALQAQDNQSGLHAFLDLQILPGTLAMSNNTLLVLTTSAQPIATTGLAFKVVVGTSTSSAQRITLTNSGDTPVPWSVSTVAENSLSWLLINDGKTGGTLDANGTDSVGISVSAIGLKSSTKPYIGSVIFTVNSTQAIVPVALSVQNTALEVVVNPDPIIAYLQGSGTCLPVTLTLINLSDQVVTWNANPYAVDMPHIHLDGQTSEQGTLDPVGLSNDTKVVKITCIGAQVGEKLYHISVYYNSVAVNVPVSVRYP
jgi:hypothetical protein